MLCNNIYSEKTNLHTWFLQVRGHSILTNTVFNWRYFSKLPNYILESREINYWLNFKYISVIILFKLKLNSPLFKESTSGHQFFCKKKKKKNQSRIKILNYTGEKLEVLSGKLIRFFSFFLEIFIYLETGSLFAAFSGWPWTHKLSIYFATVMCIGWPYTLYVVCNENMPLNNSK